MGIEFDSPFGNILFERLSPPTIPTVVDAAVRQRFGRVGAEFESYFLKDKVWPHRGLLTPQLALDFRNRYGAQLPDDTELFMLLTQERSGDALYWLTKGEKSAISTTFNQLGRNGVVTAGILRNSDMAAVSQIPTLHMPDRSLIFAQTAFKRLR